MPFDGKSFEIETKPDVFSVRGIAAWLETQPPEKTYQYTNASDCLICRYAKECGVDVFTVVPGKVKTNAFNIIEFGYDLDIVAGIEVQGEESTYGEALTRAHALLSKEG